jgi:hypothetical protein
VPPTRSGNRRNFVSGVRKRLLDPQTKNALKRSAKKMNYEKLLTDVLICAKIQNFAACSAEIFLGEER